MTDAVTPTPARPAAVVFIFISVVRAFGIIAMLWVRKQFFFARQLSASFLFADCLTGGAVLLALRSTRTELMPTVVVA